jgi:hypothetical protein
MYQVKPFDRAPQPAQRRLAIFVKDQELPVRGGLLQQPDVLGNGRKLGRRQTLAAPGLGRRGGLQAWAGLRVDRLACLAATVGDFSRE